MVLEIGSGMGEATMAMAAADPARDYLAVEAHLPGVANLLVLLARSGLTNVRIAHGDGLTLAARLAPDSLDAVHLFFPDPWPKARHHKRRIVAPEHVALLRSRLRVGGALHCATDWEPYARGDARGGRCRPGAGQPASRTRTAPGGPPGHRVRAPRAGGRAPGHRRRGGARSLRRLRDVEPLWQGGGRSGETVGPCG